jgi:aminoglycoside 6-adenylyltransferase
MVKTIDNYQPAIDTIQAIIQWAMAHEPIRAVMLTSTRAIPNSRVDALSDYDVILIVQDIHPFVADHTWLNDFGEVLVSYWDSVYLDPEFVIEKCANVTQYSDGLKIDFNLWTVGLLQQIVAMPELPAELDAGYRVLLDKDDLTVNMRAPTGRGYIPAIPTIETYQLLVNDFLSDAPYVAKCLWRDELMPAKWCLDYDMKHTYLRQMLEWRVEIDHDWSVPVGYLGKGLKKNLSPEIWTAVEQTYVEAGIDDNWKALKLTMELFRQVSKEVGDYFGYTYPDELHQRVWAYVEHIMQMDKPQS